MTSQAFPRQAPSALIYNLMKKYIDGLIAYLKWMKRPRLHMEQGTFLLIVGLSGYYLAQWYKKPIIENTQGRLFKPRWVSLAKERSLEVV